MGTTCEAHRRRDVYPGEFQAWGGYNGLGRWMVDKGGRNDVSAPITISATQLTTRSFSAIHQPRHTSTL